MGSLDLSDHRLVIQTPPTLGFPHNESYNAFTIISTNQQQMITATNQLLIDTNQQHLISSFLRSATNQQQLISRAL